MVLLFHEAATPAGSPFAPIVPAFKIPVAPVVVSVILVNAVFIHTVGVDEGNPTVLFGEIVTVAVALFAAAHEPLVRTALYEVVAVKLVAVNVVVVFAMEVPAVEKLSSDDSQRVIAPV